MTGLSRSKFGQIPFLKFNRFCDLGILALCGGSVGLLKKLEHGRPRCGTDFESALHSVFVCLTWGIVRTWNVGPDSEHAEGFVPIRCLNFENIAGLGWVFCKCSGSSGAVFVIAASVQHLRVLPRAHLVGGNFESCSYTLTGPGGNLKGETWHRSVGM
jgi:hypothetical protein